MTTEPAPETQPTPQQVVGHMLEAATRYLEDVVEAIEATPAEEHTRPTMLTLNVAAAGVMVALARASIELADAAGDDDDDDAGDDYPPGDPVPGKWYGDEPEREAARLQRLADEAWAAKKTEVPK